MKNCLNEVDVLLKKHPDINIIDIKNSLKEYEVMIHGFMMIQKVMLNGLNFLKISLKIMTKLNQI